MGEVLTLRVADLPNVSIAAGGVGFAPVALTIDGVAKLPRRAIDSDLPAGTIVVAALDIAVTIAAKLAGHAGCWQTTHVGGVAQRRSGALLLEHNPIDGIAELQCSGVAAPGTRTTRGAHSCFGVALIRLAIVFVLVGVPPCAAHLQLGVTVDASVLSNRTRGPSTFALSSGSPKLAKLLCGAGRDCVPRGAAVIALLQLGTVAGVAPSLTQGLQALRHRGALAQRSRAAGGHDLPGAAIVQAAFQDWAVTLMFRGLIAHRGLTRRLGATLPLGVAVRWGSTRIQDVKPILLCVAVEQLVAVASILADLAADVQAPEVFITQLCADG